MGSSLPRQGGNRPLLGRALRLAANMTAAGQAAWSRAVRGGLQMRGASRRFASRRRVRFRDAGVLVKASCMDIAISVNTLGSLVTLALGIFGLFWPLAAAAFVGIEPDGERGLSEIRATYGGIFLAIGLFATIAQSSDVFRVVAVGWLGAAAARSFSYVHDNSRSGANLMAILMEGAIGLSMLLPWNAFFAA
jgi:hypothetical protein